MRQLFFCLVSFTALFLYSCETPEKQVESIDNLPIETLTDFTLPELPSSMSFGGQTIEFDNFDVRERLDKEIIVNTFYHSSTIQSFKRANRYFEEIEEVLKKHNVPSDFKYLCLIESGLTQAVSPSGAKGFWQFMPGTAKEYDLTVNGQIDERLNIKKSTEAACAYLKDANKKFDNWVLTAASYNRGVHGIEMDLEAQEVSNYFDLHLNNETSRYVFRILALKLIFESPNDYGFYPEKMDLYEPVDVKTITITEDVKDIVSWSAEQGTTYRMVKLLNPWIIGKSLNVGKKTFQIQVPK